jgi:hypothetical protein
LCLFGLKFVRSEAMAISSKEIVAKQRRISREQDPVVYWGIIRQCVCIRQGQMGCVHRNAMSKALLERLCVWPVTMRWRSLIRCRDDKLLLHRLGWACAGFSDCVMMRE